MQEHISKSQDWYFWSLRTSKKSVDMPRFWLRLGSVAFLWGGITLSIIRPIPWVQHYVRTWGLSVGLFIFHDSCRYAIPLWNYLENLSEKTLFAALGRPPGVSSDSLSLRDREIGDESKPFLKEESIPLQRLRQENQHLRKMLNLRSQWQGAYQTAVLESSMLLRKKNMAIIRAGSEQKIMLGMLVLSQKGVIGRVDAVMPTWSRVILSTHPRFRIAVYGKTSGKKAIIAGNGTRALYFIHPKVSAGVEKNEIFLSSSDGDIDPDGYVVGRFREGNLETPSIDPVGLREGLVFFTSQESLQPSVSAEHHGAPCEEDILALRETE